MSDPERSAKMKPFFVALIIWTVSLAKLDAVEGSIKPNADWQTEILSLLKISAEAKGVSDLLGDSLRIRDKSWTGFVVFTCEAASDLPKRLMWVDAEVTFSNGYVREFKNIRFSIIGKGSEYDIQKIPFSVSEPVTVTKVVFKNPAIK